MLRIGVKFTNLVYAGFMLPIAKFNIGIKVLGMTKGIGYGMELGILISSIYIFFLLRLVYKLPQIRQTQPCI